MILEFTIKNILSFKERVTLNMLANSQNTLEDNYVIINDKRILKSLAIYGSNASGKSNLFKALYSVIKVIKQSNNRDVFDYINITPFKLDDEGLNSPSEFEIKLLINDIKYLYGFTLDKEKIHKEYLYYYPNGRETKIFERTNTNLYSFNKKDEKFLKDIEKKTTKNKFFLSTATNWNYEKTYNVYDFLTKKIKVFTSLEELRLCAFEMYYKNNDKLKDFTLDFFKNTDFNIEDYTISKVEFPDDIQVLYPDFLYRKDTYKVFFKHKNSNKLLSFEEESLGTQVSFSLIPFIMDSLNNNNVLVIDELDKSLHPLLAIYIVSLYNDTDINKSTAQLIFNTHDTNLLDLNMLRRDQIWFTEKNVETGVTDLYALSDFSVRKQENIEKGYLLGRYGAVPFIRNDINL